MLIDWFTVVAQAINFLILVWLLKRFLYKPILSAIDAREKGIAVQLADATSKQAEAEKDRGGFQQKNAEFDQQRDALLASATADAKAEGQRLLDEARQGADALRSARQTSLSNEIQDLNQAITLRTQKEVFAIARKTLTDLAGVTLEARMTDVFTRRLAEVDGPAKEVLADALKRADDPAVLRSTYELSPEQHTAIQNALNTKFAADIRLRFETAPDLISGFELSANGQKISWSIADYLVSLEKGIGEVLGTKTTPGTANP